MPPPTPLLPGLIVEAAGEHQGAETLGLTDGQNLSAVEGIDATVAQEEEGAGEVRTRHRDGALVAVDVQQSLHVILNIPETLHKIGKGEVAVSIEPLGAGYLLVVVDIVVGAEGADKLQHGILGMGVERYQAVRHDEGTGRAPALMNGLRGRPCSYSSCTKELNGLPEGSRPTAFHISSPMRRVTIARVNTFEIL